MGVVMPSRPKPIPGGGKRGRTPKRVKGTNQWQGWYKDKKTGRTRFGFVRVRFRETYTKSGTRIWRGPDGTPIAADAVARIKAKAKAEGRRKRIERTVEQIKTRKGSTPLERMQEGQRVWRQRVYRLQRTLAEDPKDPQELTFREAAAKLKLRRPIDDMDHATERFMRGWFTKTDASGVAVIVNNDTVHYNRWSGEEITGKQLIAMKRREQYEVAVWWVAGWNGISYAEARNRIKVKYGGNWQMALKGDSPGNKRK